MSADVIPIGGRGRSPDPEEPTLEGPVCCLLCKHEWHAVTPVGVFDSLECPACNTSHGVLASLLTPYDEAVWTCNCGNQLFVLCLTGAPLCALCGLRAQSWVDG